MYTKRVLREKSCPNCLKSFNGYHNQVFCCKACVKEWSGKVSLYPEVPSGTVGALNELKVSVDLMAKGYEVYRALSPSSSCDVLALKDKVLYAFEVRTAYRNKAGKYTFPRQRIKAEHLVLVIPDEIVYIFNYHEKLKTELTSKGKHYKVYK